MQNTAHTIYYILYCAIFSLRKGKYTFCRKRKHNQNWALFSPSQFCLYKL